MRMLSSNIPMRSLVIWGRIDPLGHAMGHACPAPAPRPRTKSTYDDVRECPFHPTRSHSVLLSLALRSAQGRGFVLKINYEFDWETIFTSCYGRISEQHGPQHPQTSHVCKKFTKHGRTGKDRPPHHDDQRQEPLHTQSPSHQGVQGICLVSEMPGGDE